MISTLLQNDVADEWVHGNWWDAIWRPYADLLGEPVVGTVLGGALVVAFYIYTDDLALPSVVLLILSGVLLSTLPGDIQGIAEGFLVVALMSSLLEAARRYIL